MPHKCIFFMIIATPQPRQKKPQKNDNKKCEKSNQQPLRCDAYEKLLKLEAVQLFILAVGLSHLLHRSHRHWTLFSLTKTASASPLDERPIKMCGSVDCLRMDWFALTDDKPQCSKHAPGTRTRWFWVHYSVWRAKLWSSQWSKWNNRLILFHAFLCCFRDSQLVLKKLSKREREEIILRSKIKYLTLLCYNIFIKKKKKNQNKIFNLRLIL